MLVKEYLRNYADFLCERREQKGLSREHIRTAGEREVRTPGSIDIMALTAAGERHNSGDRNH